MIHTRLCSGLRLQTVVVLPLLCSLLLLCPQAAGQYERLAVVIFVILLSLMNLSQNWADADGDAWIGDLMALTGSVMWAGIALIARLTPLSRARPD